MVPAEQLMTEPISAAITAGLAVERRRQSLTREEVAAAAQAAGAPDTFTSAALRNVETGRRGVTVDELAWLAAALDVPPWQLLGDQADRFTPPAPPAPAGGPVEEATRAAIDELGALDGIEAPLAAAAAALARALDDGAAMATAAVSKELRATLAQLWEGRDAEDDDDPEEYGPA